MPAAPATAPDFSALPRYYDYRHVLALFADNEAAFADAWVAGTLPPDVRRICLDMPARVLEVLLLARMNRQLDRLITILQEGELTVFDSPATSAGPARH